MAFVNEYVRTKVFYAIVWKMGNRKTIARLSGRLRARTPQDATAEALAYKESLNPLPYEWMLDEWYLVVAMGLPHVQGMSDFHRFKDNRITKRQV